MTLSRVRDSTSKVLVAGDANLDLILSGDVVPRFGQQEQLLDDARLVLGSSAGITASGLARLGLSSHLVAAIGSDDFGQITQKRLEEIGVDVTTLTTVDGGTTGLSIVLSQTADRGTLTHTGVMNALTVDDIRRACERVAPAHLHVAAYFLLPGLHNGLAEMLAWVKQQGITVSLDTNWDPSRRWQGVLELLSTVDILFPNRAELRELAATADPSLKHDCDRAATLAKFGPLIVVKNGADGAFAVDNSRQVWESPSLPAQVVDTTGAGDSFNAGYLAAHLYGEDIQESLRWGCVAGSLAVQGVGGTATQATLAHVDAVEP